jgi:hypothetical protein
MFLTQILLSQNMSKHQLLWMNLLKNPWTFQTETEGLIDIASIYTPPPSTTPEPQHPMSIRDEVLLAVKDILKGDECQSEIEELTEALSTKISLKVKALSESNPPCEDKPIVGLLASWKNSQK